MDIDAKDDDGRAAPHWATVNGHETEVQLLLEHKVDVDAKDDDGRTALWEWARGRGAAAAGAHGGC
jgi:ankyrin repeat protein